MVLKAIDKIGVFSRTSDLTWFDLRNVNYWLHITDQSNIANTNKAKYFGLTEKSGKHWKKLGIRLTTGYWETYLFWTELFYLNLKGYQDLFIQVNPCTSSQKTWNWLIPYCVNLFRKIKDIIFVDFILFRIITIYYGSLKNYKYKYILWGFKIFLWNLNL